MNPPKDLATRLDPIRRLAQNREDSAAQRLVESQQALARHEAQLREMERYLDDYNLAREGAAIAPAMLANREAFLRQLAEALRWQAGAVEEARTRLDRARELWMSKHRDGDVLDKLIDRSHNAERGRLERREQRELDEFAQRRPPSLATG